MYRFEYNEHIINEIVNKINTRQTIVFMIGVPASGKSYIANQISSKANKCIRVNMDDIMEELYGTADVTSWGELRKISKERGYSSHIVEKTSKERAKTALKNGYSVIYDATNLRVKQRLNKLRSFTSAVSHNIKTIGIIVNTDLNKVKELNTTRDRHTPWWVINKMYREAQIPNDKSNEFDDLIVIDNKITSKDLIAT